MSNYIFIELQTNEDNLCGSNGWQGHNEKDSVNKFGQMVEQAVIEAFPGVEVEVTTYCGSQRVVSDIENAESTVGSIIDEVWNSWEWLVA